jgi:hypothetical protein
MVFLSDKSMLMPTTYRASYIQVSGLEGPSSPFLIADAAISIEGRVFEAVIDYPSVIAFVLIALSFSLHKILVNKVTTATTRRIEAFESLARVQSTQRSSTEGVTEADVSAALALYQNSLEHEETLRTLIPGVRIEGQNDLKKSKNTSKGFSSGPSTALFSIAMLGLMGLLVTLALYPMAANNIWMQLEGSARSHIPSSAII